MLPAGAALAFTCWATPALSDTRGAPNAVTFLVGQAVDTDFTDLISQPWTADFVDLTMVGAAVSTRLGTMNELFGSADSGGIGDDITVEVEAGGSYRFGEESLGELWGALYFRYDGFGWNDIVYTTVAINTGLSILSETSEFERERAGGQSSLVLNYLAPEITFANPDNKNLELVLQLHHRSGIFGLIDDVSGGSTFISTGIRMRF
ncbi:MAG: hypothetical protein E6G89_20035 [Alphaproteobacteria bacterium]|nr:MAG: hypothetical protein E6G89_20035 [Alphaproteobacteria bacterium]TMJ37603.1 MAG: hypothetical protein E6G87_08080 [Alphaproteobacteria bacterium]